MRMISSHWEWIVIAVVFVITSPGLFFRRQRRATRLRAMTDPVDGTVRVTNVDHPPAFGAMNSSCAFEGVLQAPGVPTRPVRFTGMAASTRWPQQDSALAVTVDRANPQNWLVRWERVPAVSDRGFAKAQELAEQLNDSAGEVGHEN